MSRFLFLLTILTGFSCYVRAQNASFFKEHITFKIEEGYFYVNGEYYLRRSDTSFNHIVLFYPLPTDSIYAPVDSILIYNSNMNREIADYKKVKTGILFNLELDSVTLVMISYRQQLRNNVARYILTTTQQWGKPLEEVTYELIAPTDLKITSFSYPPDSRENFGDMIIYYWRKENFWPLKDMIFTFE
jgi:hypothetical protein